MTKHRFYLTAIVATFIAVAFAITVPLAPAQTYSRDTGDSESQALDALYAARDAAYDSGNSVREREIAMALADRSDAPYDLAYYGLLLTEGIGGPADKIRGAHFIEQAARLGSLDAQVWMARLYVDGDGVPQNYDAAICWLRVASDRNFMPALSALRWVLSRKTGYYGTALLWVSPPKTGEYVEERAAVSRKMEKLGHPIWFFANGMTKLATETEEDDVDGLMFLIIADKYAEDVMPDETRSLVSNQLAYSIERMESQGRGQLVAKAKQQAAAWSPPKRTLLPHSQPKAAACVY